MYNIPSKSKSRCFISINTLNVPTLIKGQMLPSFLLLSCLDDDSNSQGKKKCRQTYLEKQHHNLHLFPMVKKNIYDYIFISSFHSFISIFTQCSSVQCYLTIFFYYHEVLYAQFFIVTLYKKITVSRNDSYNKKEKLKVSVCLVLHLLDSTIYYH